MKKLLFLLPLLALLYFLPKKPPAPFPVEEEKPIVIVIPAYQNAPFVEKTLHSVYTQNYNNYRVIYIDDNSRDSSFELAKKTIHRLDKFGHTHLIQNASNKGTLANYYNALHTLENHEIALFLNGDDFLAHENVLQILNEAYADPNVWVTFGGSLNYPSYTPLEKETHLLTVYAALFKEIPLSRLFYRGKFYTMEAITACKIPLLQLAGPHAKKMRDPLYLKNTSNPLTGEALNPVFAAECRQAIENAPALCRLKKLPRAHLFTKEKADVLLLTENRERLEKLLNSIEEHLTGYGKITIRGPDDPFPNSAINEPYLLIMKDDQILTSSLDLSEGIAELKKTKAYALHYAAPLFPTYSSQFQRFQTVPTLSPLARFFAWQYAKSSDEWGDPEDYRCTLYRTRSLQKKDVPEDAVGLVCPISKTTAEKSK